MPNALGVVKVVLTGFTGGPGLMQFHFQGGTPGSFSNADATAAIAAVYAFVNSIKNAFYGGVTLQVQSVVEVIDWTTGALQAVTTGVGVTGVVSTGTGSALVAEGPLVQWFTNTVVGRRMLRGRTFLVPSNAGAISPAGTITGSLQTTIQAAAAALAATVAVTLSVWHRPEPYATGANGLAAAVQTTAVPSIMAVLRSRRD